jgi:hypothetical protein
MDDKAAAQEQVAQMLDIVDDMYERRSEREGSMKLRTNSPDF